MANKLVSSLRRLGAVSRKEVRQLSRDRVTFGMIVGVPLMQMLLFGFAINFDVRHLSTVVLDEANTSMSREFVSQLVATQVVDVRYRTASSSEVDRLLREGRASLAVIIPGDFERRLGSDTRAVVQILVDGSQPSLAGVAAGLASVPMITRHGQGPYSGGKRMEPRRVEVRTLYNPEKRTAVQIVPALIGVILTMTMVVFTAGAIVRERERGNLELLIATPLGRLELMIGKLLPFVVIGLIQTTIILVVGSALFNVPVVGSLLNLYAAALLFIASTLGLGLFVSTLAQTQFQAFQLAFLTLLPSILLSGFMFPFEGMPLAAQWIAQVLPLTHFNVILRGIVLRGADLPEVWPQLLKLAVFLVIMLSVAVARFKKRLD
ncbi:MAG TPA: ABC transporter permease [Steroidobacteraceae bacterium]|nr:ABC transporter permease [Steroidobacteraceae bacterium]